MKTEKMGTEKDSHTEKTDGEIKLNVIG